MYSPTYRKEKLIKKEEDLYYENRNSNRNSLTDEEINLQLQEELRKCEEVEAFLKESIHDPNSETSKISSISSLSLQSLGELSIIRQQNSNNMKQKLYGVGLLPQKQDVSTSLDDFFTFGPLKDKDIAQFACSVKGENVLCLSTDSDLYWYSDMHI